MNLRGENSPRAVLVAAAFIVLAIGVRVAEPVMLGHPSNFAPMTAIALFSGAVFARRQTAVVLSLLAVIISDLIVNSALYGSASPFYEGCYWQYLGYALVAVLASPLRGAPSVLRIAAGGACASLLFFVISNFGVWCTSGLYPHTGAGLLSCFAMALPFYRASLASDMFFSIAIFGAAALVSRGLPSFAAQRTSDRAAIA